MTQRVLQSMEERIPSNRNLLLKLRERGTYGKQTTQGWTEFTYLLSDINLN